MKLFLFFFAFILLVAMIIDDKAGATTVIMPNPPRVAIIGDSITKHGEPYLHHSRPNWYIDAQRGRKVSKLPGRVDVLASKFNSFPENVILALGTNETSSWRKSDYESVVKKFPEDVNVYFVT